MLLWTEAGVQGACLLTFPDSVRPIERYYPYSLPKPWGQAGSIGVSASLRGQGYGSYLLDASLRRLHDNGINGCVIDWTDLLHFYGRFGFHSRCAATFNCISASISHSCFGAFHHVTLFLNKFYKTSGDLLYIRPVYWVRNRAAWQHDKTAKGCTMPATQRLSRPLFSLVPILLLLVGLLLLAQFDTAKAADEAESPRRVERRNPQ